MNLILLFSDTHVQSDIYLTLLLSNGRENEVFVNSLVPYDIRKGSANISSWLIFLFNRLYDYTVISASMFSIYISSILIVHSIRRISFCVFNSIWISPSQIFCQTQSGNAWFFAVKYNLLHNFQIEKLKKSTEHILYILLRRKDMKWH